MKDNEYVKVEHLMVSRWVAHPALLIQEPGTWQDVMVRPEDAGAAPGFTIDVATPEVHLEDGASPEECAIPDGQGELVRAESMSVIVKDPFTNEEAIDHARTCMAACGIPVRELVVVEPDEFFDF